MFEEEDADMLTPNYWAAEQTEDVPAIDAILNHRPRASAGKCCYALLWLNANQQQAKISRIQAETTLSTMYVIHSLMPSFYPSSRACN